ncbi:MAG: hypothetical protein HN712_27710 [Gemmatimonadetes bacterium]|jgi:hypothetical protein|nr:hypothetical protein [Gemmatimonadota bacterium]MBT6149418.1 hypothetical protein [Gemmatimonadota bacterium]MBT7864129.1 hypothetical protein [Gemmatimonadota bacterium]
MFQEEYSYSIFSLALESAEQEVALQWISSLSAAAAQALGRLGHLENYYQAPFVVVEGLPYRLGLGVEDDHLVATVATPIRWHTSASNAGTTALVAVGDQLLLLAGEQPYSLTSDWHAEDKLPLAGQISAARLWEIERRNRRDQRMGLCLAERNQVLVGASGINPNTGEVRWPFYSSLGVQVLGEGSGSGPGLLLWPLSVAGTLDGRMFVLDAGNARIQVFGDDGEYLTHWGGRGSGPGEFDFLDGPTHEDFSGSVVVDDEGFIYVADVGNQRIQKFAP